MTAKTNIMGAHIARMLHLSTLGFSIVPSFIAIGGVVFELRYEHEFVRITDTTNGKTLKVKCAEMLEGMRVK